MKALKRRLIVMMLTGSGALFGSPLAWADAACDAGSAAGSKTGYQMGHNDWQPYGGKSLQQFEQHWASQATGGDPTAMGIYESCFEQALYPAYFAGAHAPNPNLGGNTGAVSAVEELGQHAGELANSGPVVGAEVLVGGAAQGIGNALGWVKGRADDAGRWAGGEVAQVDQFANDRVQDARNLGTQIGTDLNNLATGVSSDLQRRIAQENQQVAAVEQQAGAIWSDFNSQIAARENPPSGYEGPGFNGSRDSSTSGSGSSTPLGTSGSSIGVGTTR